jgi:S4 domain protein YaaA
MEEYVLKKEFITLGQLLKEMDVISSGRMAKIFLQEEEVLVNGELENRRGRKLYDQMKVETMGQIFLIREANEEEKAQYLEEEAEKQRVQEMVRKMNQENKKKAKRKPRPQKRQKAKPQSNRKENPNKAPKFPGTK